MRGDYLVVRCACDDAVNGIYAVQESVVDRLRLFVRSLMFVGEVRVPWHVGVIRERLRRPLRRWLPPEDPPAILTLSTGWHRDSPEGILREP